MARLLNPVVVGDVRVEHFEVPKSNLGGIYYGAEAPPPGTYVRLMMRQTLWMSDTPFEHSTNREALRHAHGDVLIGGLGIGMITTAMLAKPSVRKVVVIEKYGDVVEAVRYQLRERLPKKHYQKLLVHVADVNEWRPFSRETRYNAIYFDIWPDLCTDYLAEMTKLGRAFRHYLAKTDSEAWMGFWGRERLRYQREQEKRMGW